MFIIKKFVKPALLMAALAVLTLPAACSMQASAVPPAPTMSQQQIDELQSAMKYYYDTYGDIYAVIALRDMFEAGQITQDDYSGAYAQAGDTLSRADIKEYRKLRDALNCTLTRFSEKDLLKCRAILMEAMKKSPVLISIFDTQQLRDAVENAVKITDEWALSPDDSHTANMEAELNSEELNCGARVYLYYYVAALSGSMQSVNADGETYDPAYYIEKRLGGYLNDALAELLVQKSDDVPPAAINGF